MVINGLKLELVSPQIVHDFGGNKSTPVVPMRLGSLLPRSATSIPVRGCPLLPSRV